MNNMQTTKDNAGCSWAKWKAQDAEWYEIGKEMAQANPGRVISVGQVTEEQARRMEARGEHRLSFDEINSYLMLRLEQAKAEGAAQDPRFHLASWIERKDQEEAAGSATSS